MRESSGRHAVVEDEHGNYLGLYQMGKAALMDAGYFRIKDAEKSDTNYDQDWQGTWTGKLGVNSRKDFLTNPEVQEIAIREYHHMVERYLKSYLKKEFNYTQEYHGKEIGGILMTKGAILAAGHLVGHTKLAQFIASNGTKDATDGNGVPCSEYLRFFSDRRYDQVDIDYKTRQKDYEQKILNEKIEKYQIDPKQLLQVAEYYKKLKELDERLQKLFQKFDADNVETAQKEANKLHEQLTCELQNYIKELSASFEQKNQELYAKYSNELAQLTEVRVSTMQAIGDKHTIITNHDLAQQKQQEYDNAMANFKKEQEKLVAAKEKELKAKGENAIAQIIQNIGQKSNEQKLEVKDYIDDFSDKLKSGENIELVIHELDSFIQQFEDTPTV